MFTRVRSPSKLLKAGKTSSSILRVSIDMYNTLQSLTSYYTN